MKPIRLIVSMLLLVVTAIGNASDIHFITHSAEGKSYFDDKGELRGHPDGGKRAFNIELARALMQEVGYSPKIIRIQPFKRGFRNVISVDNIAFFSVARRPEREKKVKWVGPFQLDIISFYESTQFPTRVNSVEDAKKVKRICVLNGTFHEKLLAERGISDNIQRANSYESCLKMLKRGRVNLIVVSDLTLKDTLKTTNTPSSDIRVALTFHKIEGYMAMSKNISDVEVKHWQSALDALKESGTYRQLFERYLE